jgi:hypothetical protein
MYTYNWAITEMIMELYQKLLFVILLAFCFFLNRFTIPNFATAALESVNAYGSKLLKLTKSKPIDEEE